MKNKYRVYISLSIILFIMALITIFAYRQEAQTNNSNQVQQEQDDAPVADFNTLETLNPREREKRVKRSNKYRTNTLLQKMEDQPTVFDLPPSHSPPENPLPVQQSDVIVIGTVINSQAFVTNDKTGVYSEFDIKVERILKNGLQLNNSNLVITAERTGGYVLFPSGRKQRRGEFGHNLPQRNKTYIFFLKWNAEGESFSILTGYEVQGQQVNPLDGLKRNNPRIYRGYEQFKNANLNDFILRLQGLIGNSSQGEQNDE